MFSPVKRQTTQIFLDNHHYGRINPKLPETRQAKINSFTPMESILTQEGAKSFLNIQLNQIFLKGVAHE